MVPDPHQVPQKAQSPAQRFLVKVAHAYILNTDSRCFNSLLRRPNGQSHGMRVPSGEDFCCSQLGATKVYPPDNELLLAPTRNSAKIPLSACSGMPSFTGCRRGCRPAFSPPTETTSNRPRSPRDDQPVPLANEPTSPTGSRPSQRFPESSVVQKDALESLLD